MTRPLGTATAFHYAIEEQDKYGWHHYASVDTHWTEETTVAEMQADLKVAVGYARLNWPDVTFRVMEYRTEGRDMRL